ncbi:murein hydrolase activator EnvC family protein [Candidatus Magnetaquicoccus inordinatus]|uniref:murein hydrolase activator EnvC family protein n=1 Tax=Candidatus Magnetaquicoccus inordinatus TaxID=2496818 RepID=UPI00102C44B4|nr:peptidoglycan DD-metalloendopeptidase family protein [Candidatus Magnetaquicoccus inordinatus]
MNSIKNMRRLWHSWYMMVACMALAILLLLAPESMASENHGFSTQVRLAEHSRLMYGLEGQQVESSKQRRKKAALSSAQRGKKNFATQKRRKNGGVGLYARKQGTLSAGHGEQLHKSKWQRTKGKSFARRSYKRNGAAHQGQPTRGKRSIFSATAERRMGTFLGPVNGSAVNRSSGLFFRVPENADVRASSRGQVVYAGWFRGYGLLTILNHGGRVYSLYGHNRDLLVAKGDVVEPGQVIAKSGKTGSVDGVPGLYFEIRKGNRPENPRRWLARDRAHSDKMASLMH